VLVGRRAARRRIQKIPAKPQNCKSISIIAAIVARREGGSFNERIVRAVQITSTDGTQLTHPACSAVQNGVLAVGGRHELEGGRTKNKTLRSTVLAFETFYGRCLESKLGSYALNHHCKTRPRLAGGMQHSFWTHKTSLLGPWKRPLFLITSGCSCRGFKRAIQ
jgi:hypothetical protein